MTKKADKPFRMLPLQKGTVREITDPAEQAAIDDKIKRAEKSAAVVVTMNGVLYTAKVPAVLELCGVLSVEERLEIMEQLAADMPAEVVRRFVERLQASPLAARDSGNGADGYKRQ